MFYGTRGEFHKHPVLETFLYIGASAIITAALIYLTGCSGKKISHQKPGLLENQQTYLMSAGLHYDRHGNLKEATDDPATWPGL